MRGIELARGEDARLIAAADLRRIAVIGQITGHQRHEPAVGPDGLQDPRAIGFRRGDVGHRWGQIGHDDGTAELARGRTGHGLQHRAIAQVDVPIVGAADGQAVGHAGVLIPPGKMRQPNAAAPGVA